MLMSGFEDALVIDFSSTDEQLQNAAQALATGGVVIFESSIILRDTANYLECRLIDTTTDCHRCENEYEVLAENARRLLESSRFGQLLAKRPCRWMVVASEETGAPVLWRAPL